MMLSRETPEQKLRRLQKEKAKLDEETRKAKEEFDAALHEASSIEFDWLF